jgi:hypothetical protein
MLERLESILRDIERRRLPQDLLDPLNYLKIQLTADLKGHKPHAQEDDVRTALEKFKRGLRMRNSTDAIFVCLGCLVPTGPKKQKLIEDTSCFPAVLSGVEPYRKHLMVFQDCYKGLLDAYLGYHPEGKHGQRAAWPNWERLRDWLSAGTSDIYDPTFQEDWVAAVRAHPELFTTDPLQTFGRSLLEGKTCEFEEFVRALGVDKDSWLEEEVIRAQIRAAAESKGGIVAHLDALIDSLRRVADGNKYLFNHALAEVFTHYYAQTAGEIHEGLRDIALDYWGNPMQDGEEDETKFAWASDGWALLDDEPRAMAKAWFAAHIIERFFKILTKKSERQDREKMVKRKRRMEFWVQYARVLTDVKFALGPYARTDTDPRMRELLQLMSGMTLNLQGGGDRENNAFIMRFGDLVVVEFGLEANACFIYRASDFPFKGGDTSISTQDIKSRVVGGQFNGGPIRLEHRDSPSGASRWEGDFQRELEERGIYMNRPAARLRTASAGENPKRVCQSSAASVTRPRVQSNFVPVETKSPTKAQSSTEMTQVESRRRAQIETPPGMTQIKTRRSSQTVEPVFGEKEERELLAICRRFSVPVRDMREHEGNLWVIHNSEEDNRLTALLNRYGFKYRAGRGWWWKQNEV